MRVSSLAGQTGDLVEMWPSAVC